VGVFKKIVKQLNPAKAIKNVIRSQAEITQVALQGATGVIQSAGQTLGAATTVVQENPILGQALGSAVPGLGGLFGGSAAALPAPEPTSGNFSQPAAPAVPVWVWLAAAGAGVLGLVLLLRKKA
jgi:hypothetical protein